MIWSRTGAICAVLDSEILCGSSSLIPGRFITLIGHIDVLPKLFTKVFLLSVVHGELAHIEAPDMVRGWLGELPSWLEILPAAGAVVHDPTLDQLDSGERAAISLATSLGADLLLMDERIGVTVARRKGFAVTGTLGVLDLAARRGLLDLAEALARLKTTNFRYRQKILDDLLAQHKPAG
jgi:predicted nucleic acid-binding protein